MAHAGKEIRSTQLGLRMIFRETASDTNGEALRLDVFVDPDRAILGKHMHPLQEERIEVVAGGLRGEVGGEPKALAPGDISAIPPGTMHHWASEPGPETHLRLQFQPALRTEVVFETLLGLASDGKVRRNGMPRFLQASVFIAEYGEELYFPIPGPIKKAMAVGVAPVARRLGHRPSYPQYSGGDRAAASG